VYVHTLLPNILVYVTCCRGFAQWRCDTLCISGFMDDVILSRSGPHGACRIVDSVAASEVIASSNRNQIYLLKTQHVYMQQVVEAVDEQGQRGSKEPRLTGCTVS